MYKISETDSDRQKAGQKMVALTKLKRQQTGL
jgi:hypothetical protein